MVSSVGFNCVTVRRPFDSQWRWSATSDLFNDVTICNESITCTVGRMIVREVGIA